MATVEQQSDATRTHEGLRIRQWRLHQFFELGFPLSDARKLADSPADVAQARKLVRTGCSHPLAFRILR